MGWKLFRFYDDVPADTKDWKDLLSTMDFAMYSVGDVSDKEGEGLLALGFSRERFECDTSPGDPMPRIAKSKSGYGPYWIYRKK